MVTRLSGVQKRAKRKLTKPTRRKGKVSFTKYFQELNEGDKVSLRVESAVRKGIYPMQFHNKVGVVRAKKGKCYEVSIMDGSKEKLLHIHPVHLAKK